MSDGEKHALLSPSGAEKWGNCPGSVLMEKDIPNTSSPDADLGTAQHECAAFCLVTETDAEKYIGAAFNDITLDADMADSVQEYVGKVRELSKGHTLLVEQKLPIGHVTGEEDAEGTGDAIIIYNDNETLGISDAKFGYNKVFAKKNPQLMLYALGALYQFSVVGNFKKFILRIHQPRINHFDEWECTIEELNEFADAIKFKTNFIWRLLKGEVEFKPNEDLVPSEKTCQWCRAKASCPKAISHSLSIIADDFTDLTANPTAKFQNALSKLETIDNAKLAKMMSNVDLLEDIIKAVRRRVEAELFAGHDVPGFKLVQGKKGNRKWEDEKLVEKTMKDWRMKTDDIYKMKVISPADAEKFFKDNPKRWAKLKELYVQSDGQPSVAPSTDPRQALELGAREDDFDVIEDNS
jgi:hypothetical protein